MGRRATSGGVEIRPNSIRIAFTYRAAACRETLRVNGAPLAPTPANVEYARRLAETIRVRIRAGNFVYAEFFPDSERAEKPAAGDEQTFGDAADLWFDSVGQLTPATLDQYKTGLRLWKRLIGAGTPIRDLTYQHLKALVGKHPWASPKSANNYLIVLRGVMAFVYHGPDAMRDPMLAIRNLKVVRKKPDPLTGEERDRVLSDMAERYDPRVWTYFAFAFATGMRPEEQIALRWDDIDEATGTARVQRVRTFRGSERDGSKTHAERDVDLVPAALEALRVMRPYTRAKAPEIFESPVTGRPWHDERSQRDTFWRPTLRRLGIRTRRAYATRHTYATIALMANVNPAYVADQMGHVGTKTFFERYARWIRGADKGVQRAAMAAAFGGISPNLPQPQPASDKPLIRNGEFGRRDWIRTSNRGPKG